MGIMGNADRDAEAPAEALPERIVSEVPVEKAITIEPAGLTLQVREHREGSDLPHRRVVVPGSVIDGVWVETDLSEEPPEVAEAAAELWTPEEVEAYAAEQLSLIREVTKTDLYAERERRISVPLRIVGLSVGSIEINMDGESQRNLGGLATSGILAKMTGSTNKVEFKAYDNNIYALTGDDLIAMGLQVFGHIQACYRAEWALKDMSPIPHDFTDDKYWP